MFRLSAGKINYLFFLFICWTENHSLIYIMADYSAVKFQFVSPLIQVSIKIEYMNINRVHNKVQGIGIEIITSHEVFGWIVENVSEEIRSQISERFFWRTGNDINIDKCEELFIHEKDSTMLITKHFPVLVKSQGENVKVHTCMLKISYQPN